jgi:hypothetical protein
MALKRGSLGQETPYIQPLESGFVYTPRSEIEGFELRPEILKAMTQRLEELEKYKHAPKDFNHHQTY